MSHARRLRKLHKLIFKIRLIKINRFKQTLIRLVINYPDYSK